MGKFPKPLSFSGRSGRLEFFMWGNIVPTLIFLIFVGAGIYVEKYINKDVLRIFIASTMILVGCLSCSATVRRFRDIGVSVWLVPLFYLSIVFLQIVQKGMSGLGAWVFWLVQITLIALVVFTPSDAGVDDAAFEPKV